MTKQEILRLRLNDLYNENNLSIYELGFIAYAKGQEHIINYKKQLGI